MSLVNRSIAIVKPRKPYLDWCRKDDDTGVAEAVFEDLRTEPHTYLLPEYEDSASQRRVLSEFWPAIFESMVEGWLRDEASWPQDRTRGMFDEWFDVQMCSIVEDLHDHEPLDLV